MIYIQKKMPIRILIMFLAYTFNDLTTTL